jgi:hypothetical protein
MSDELVDILSELNIQIPIIITPTNQAIMIQSVIRGWVVRNKYNRKPSVELNKTFTHTIENYSFGNLPADVCCTIFKDGRPFSHFIEKWIENNYPLKHISGCKSYDFVDDNDDTILYDEKTFTKGGCNFCPSNMLGQGRKFDKDIFSSKCKKLIYCIVSNINFPEIKIRFVKGYVLERMYPNAKIPLKDHVKFFN